MKTLLIACFSILSLVAVPAFAQFDTDSLVGNSLSIELQPEFPKPGEQVTATINDYSGGVYGASIAWFLDGQAVPDAANQRQTTITADPTGKQQKIEIILTKPGGEKSILSTVIKPVYLDIVIEPQTHVPDFYQGRALPSLGSTVNATALISGKGFKDTDLMYTWRMEQTVLQGGPIRGTNQVSFVTPMGESFVLSLQVTELDGTVIARRAILIPSVSPEIHFYEVSSLFGMSKRALTSSLPIIGNSVMVKAEPYHLDSMVYNDPDIHEWRINRSVASNSGSNPYEVTLERVGSTGLSNLEFHVRDTKQVLQGAKADIDINF